MCTKPQFRVSRKNLPEGDFRRSTQRANILALLLDACGAWVPLPEIMACAAQYNARVLELRRLGFAIENKTERVSGARRSWFRLIVSAAVPAPTPNAEPAKSGPERKNGPRLTGLPLFDVAARQ